MINDTINVKIRESDLDTLVDVLESYKGYVGALAGNKAKDLYSGIQERLRDAKQHYKINSFDPPA